MLLDDESLSSFEMPNDGKKTPTLFRPVMLLLFDDDKIEMARKPGKKQKENLDDKSLSLVIQDAKDDGKKVLTITTEHYLGKAYNHVFLRDFPSVTSLASFSFSLQWASHITTYSCGIFLL